MQLLLILLKSESLLLEPLLYIDYFLFFNSQLPAYFSNLVFEFFFELNYALLPPLHLYGFPAHLLLDLRNLVHAFHEHPLPFNLLGLPLGGDLLDAFELPLLEPCLELLLLRSFPQLELPHCLVCRVRVQVLLRNPMGEGTLSRDVLLGMRGAWELTKVLEVKDASNKTLGLPGLRVSDRQILVAHSHGGLRGLLKGG